MATDTFKVPFAFCAFISGATRSGFVRNVLLVMTGTAIAQAIGFAVSPVISRLFSPAAFGVFGSFNAVASAVGTVVTLQYSQAILLPKENGDAFNVLVLSCLVAVLVSGLCLVACLIVPASVNSLMKTTGMWSLVLLAVSALVTGVNQAFQAWCIRAKAFKHTSASQVVRSLSSNGLQLGCGCVKTGPLGLIGSAVLADIVASLNLARVVLRDWRLLRHRVGWQPIRRLASEYHDFPLYSASSNLINSLSLGLPMLLLTHFYSLAVAGGYAFAMRVLSTPMNFVLTALRQVLFQKAAEAHNAGRRLIGLYAKITLGLFGVALLPSLALIAFAPRCFAWVFGAQWLQAGEFASSLVIWMLFMFSNLPAALFARIIRIQRQMFIFDISLLVARSVGLYLGGQYLAASTTILMFAAIGGVMNIIFIGLVWCKLRRYEATRQAETLTADRL